MGSGLMGLRKATRRECFIALTSSSWLCLVTVSFMDESEFVEFCLRAYFKLDKIFIGHFSSPEAQVKFSDLNFLLILIISFYFF